MFRIGALSLLFALSAAAGPVSYQVTINNIPTFGSLFFTLTDGGLPSNSVTITNFVATGFTLVVPNTQGGVSGGLPGPLTLTDANGDFFSLYRADMTSFSPLATISFHVDFTNLAPDAGSFPDGFAFYLLQENLIDVTFISVLPSSDPTGAQALLAIDGGSVLNIYNPNVSAVATPEPSSLLLSGLGLTGLWFALARKGGQRGTSVQAQTF